MGTAYLKIIPDNVHDHLREIVIASGLEYNDDNVELMAKKWLEKNKFFDRTLKKMNMKLCDFLPKDDDRGALVLTYSGSLIRLSPIMDRFRNIDYISLKVREDVPGHVKNDKSILAEDVRVNERMHFKIGPVKTTSHVFKMAVVEERLTAAEENKKLTKATVIFADKFSKINRAELKHTTAIYEPEFELDLKLRDLQPRLYYKDFEPAAKEVIIEKDFLAVCLVDGREIKIPMIYLGRLLHATDKERNNWELICDNERIYWQDLDEYISIRELLYFA